MFQSLAMSPIRMTENYKCRRDQLFIQLIFIQKILLSTVKPSWGLNGFVDISNCSLLFRISRLLSHIVSLVRHKLFQSCATFKVTSLNVLSECY